MLRIKLKKGTEEGVYNQPASFHILIISSFPKEKNICCIDQTHKIYVTELRERKKSISLTYYQFIYV